jgi:periplasmic protein TonB
VNNLRFLDLHFTLQLCNLIESVLIMTIWKQKHQSHRQISSNYYLLLYFLASILIHGLVAIALGTQLRSLPVVQEKPKNDPIEFVIVPPEEKQEKPPSETKRRGANNSVAQGKIKSDKPPATDERGSTATDSNATSTQLKVKESPTTPPVTLKPDETVKETVKSTPPATKTPNQPKPVEPSQPPKPEKASRDRSMAASKPTPSGEEILPQKTEPNPPVATRLPPQPKPLPKSPTTPSNSNTASLLGGTYKRSIKDDNGSSFFNAEATASKEAPFAKLDAQQDELAPYFDEIRRRVKRNWQPLSPEEEQTTILTFAIQRSGQITELKIIQTSGNEQVDRDALEAVQKSAPFDALPQSFKSDRLDIQFNFNIYIQQGSFSPSLESNW